MRRVRVTAETLDHVLDGTKLIVYGETIPLRNIFQRRQNRMEVPQSIQGSDCNGHVNIDFADPCCQNAHHKEIIIALITRTMIYREGDALLVREQDYNHQRDQ